MGDRAERTRYSFPPGLIRIVTTVTLSAEDCADLVGEARSDAIAKQDLDLRSRIEEGGLVAIVSPVKMTLAELVRVGRHAVDYERSEGLRYLLELVEDGHAPEIAFSFEGEGLKVSAVVEAPIDERTLARHRLLWIAGGSVGGEVEGVSEDTFEGRLADEADFVPIEAYEHVKRLREPYWKNWPDLHFAQLFFDAAFGDEMECPWEETATDGEVICERVVDRAAFVDCVLRWAAQEDDRLIDVDVALALAEAALRLDVKEFWRLARPIVRGEDDALYD